MTIVFAESEGGRRGEEKGSRRGVGEGGGMKENREGESPEYSRTAAGRGRFAFSVPQRGPVITHILRSPTVKINLSGDPTQPHPLASLRAAPVLADAAGEEDRIEGRGGEIRSAASPDGFTAAE